MAAYELQSKPKEVSRAAVISGVKSSQRPAIHRVTMALCMDAERYVSANNPKIERTFSTFFFFFFNPQKPTSRWFLNHPCFLPGSRTSDRPTLSHSSAVVELGLASRWARMPAFSEFLRALVGIRMLKSRDHFEESGRCFHLPGIVGYSIGI